MSDGQFINLVKVAYDEMITLWMRSGLNEAGGPGAMRAFESDGKMYFASSVRTPLKPIYNDEDAAMVAGTVSWYFNTCLQGTLGDHSHNRMCAEPNRLQLFCDGHTTVHWQPTDPPQPYCQSPSRSPGSPRMAVWGRTDGPPVVGGGSYFEPCADSRKRYGCHRMARTYGLVPTRDVPPDADGQDDWVFEHEQNPRTCKT
ncbi:hypothetical protein EJ08DRAFT_657030 [Tothia fuscella]|uniref:Uncharacterized protein n=1 Tax=Tothia fuscella TaxID=1048955 RepID=A0A9P4U2S1_9PEZI|nr:hypothetical protein EJ08DRAFT_657030 [Tothia fuscella]